MIALERFAIRHLRDWLALVNEPAICRAGNRRYPVSARHAAAAWLATFNPGRTGRRFQFAVMHAGCFVGWCAVHDVNPEQGTGWISYWIGRRFWNQGFATAAVRALLVVAAEEIGLSEVHARCLADNQASQRVLIRCAFTPMGHQAFTERRTGRQVATFVYGVRLSGR